MSSINSGSIHNSKACSGNYSQCNEPNKATVCRLYAFCCIHLFDDTMRRNLLNLCDLVSISKKLMFCVLGVVRIY